MSFYNKFLCSLLLIVCGVPGVSSAVSQVKTGISNCIELQNITTNLAGDYELIDDIDCSGVVFRPIGNLSAPFTGSLDGNRYIIENLSINSSDIADVGMFVWMQDAHIKNIIFRNAEIVALDPYVSAFVTTVGTLAGRAYSTEITGVETHGKITANVRNIYSNASYVGGLVGSAEGSTVISDSFSTMEVNGYDGAGGLVGGNFATITNSYATGKVTGDPEDGFFAGGLVGNNGGYILNSYATGMVSGYRYVGGLVGQSSNLIRDSYATSEVYGSSEVGGLIGYAYQGDTISSYATGEINGSAAYVGGLIGFSAYVNITDTYATGKVTSKDEVPGKGTGGLIGHAGANSSITNSYATGAVSGATPNSMTGGLVGLTSLASVKSSYWDMETTGQRTSGGGAGKTTAEMYQRSTYVDWDFMDIWDIKDGQSYPWLLTEEGDGIRTCTQLQEIQYGDLDGNYELSADIDCSGVNFSPIGTLQQPFTGVLEGNGHSIFFLTIPKANESFIGLFGRTSRAQIKNLKLKRTEVVGQKYVGTLIGYASNGTQVSNVHVDGSVSSEEGSHPDKSHMGGLIGTLDESTVQNSSAAVTVNGSQANFVGGLVGENAMGIIENSFATETVFAQQYAGGLIGYSYGGRVNNTYAIGAVVGSGMIGGLIGAGDTPVASSYWDIYTSRQSSSAGGTGKTTTEMRQQRTYVDWDFTNVWAIREGVTYPWLSSSL